MQATNKAARVMRSSVPDLEIPNLSLHEFIYRETLPRYANDIALIDAVTSRSYTYQQLHDYSYNVAIGLHQHGLQQGEVLCIYAPNCPEYVIMQHAVSRLGAITTPCSPLYPAEALAHQLVDSQAKYITTIPAALSIAKEAAAKAGGIRKIFVFGPEEEGTVAFSFLMHAKGVLPYVNINPKEDTALLPYSSGTTSLPKGVILTHRNIVTNLLQITALQMIHEKEVLIGILPFFHIYANTAVVGVGLIKGAKIVVLPKFDLPQFLEALQNHGVTFAHIVPPIALALAKHPIVSKYKLSKLRGVMSGAAPLGADTEKEIQDRLHISVRQGYGMTELSPVTHISQPGDPQGSIGTLVPNCLARLVKEDGTDAGVGEDGELWVKGPNVMKGYLNNPAETHNCIDMEGYLHTGDVARSNDSGHIWIVDRVKELIKYKGFQVPPAELEALLLTHPAVADVAVIGVPDEAAGELPKAYVVLKQGHTVTEKEISEWLHPKVPHYKLLRGGIEFTNEIPKSASGKILRRFLRDRERERLSKAKL